MKRFFILLALLIFAGGVDANAKVLRLGNQDVACEIPEGYVEASGDVYAPLLSYLRTQYPPGMTIGLVLVSRGADEKLRSGSADSVDDYIILTHERLAGEMDMVDFITLKEYLIDEFKRSSPEQLDDALGAVFETGEGQASFKVSQAALLVSETPNSFSHLFTGILAKGDDSSELLLLHTMKFCGGELLHIYHYCTDGSGSQAFLQKAKDVPDQMRLSPLKEYKPAEDAREGAIRGGVFGVGGMLLVCAAALAAGLWWYRRRTTGR